MRTKKVNIENAAKAQITEVFDPHIVADVNESQVKVAYFGAEFDWHSHPNEDEAFFVVSGRIAIDFRDGPVEMGAGDFLLVSKGVEHRPRALSDRPLVMMFEPASTLNTGDRASNLTVARPKRLSAG